MFLRGLREGGVPIKFASWHTFIFSVGGTANVNLLIQERSRSVKALFAVQRRAPVNRTTDSGACFFDTGATGNSMQNYQYRIGGRYFPAAPVQTSTTVGSAVTNGGAEAYVELEKAMNIVGDYRLSTSCNSLRWATTTATANISTGANSTATAFNELDYSVAIVNYVLTNTIGPVYSAIALASASVGNSLAGNVGSSCYTSSVSLETSNGLEISGLNAEEQSDISFIANWSATQASGFIMEVYSYYDAMIILRENNVIELIQ